MSFSETSDFDFMNNIFSNYDLDEEFANKLVINDVSSQPNSVSAESQCSTATISLPDLLDEYLNLLDQFHPGWDEYDPQTDKKLICIPEMLDVTKQYVGPQPKSENKKRNKRKSGTEETKNWIDWAELEKPSGFSVARYEHGLLHGDNTELLFFERMISLNIGGILVANVDKHKLKTALRERFGSQLPAKIAKYSETNMHCEFDFIFLHPKIGFFYIEVKGEDKANKDNKRGLYCVGVKQMKNAKAKIQTMLDACADSGLSADQVNNNWRILCMPFAEIDFPPMDIGTESYEHIGKETFADREKFLAFWKEKLDATTTDQNLFRDKEFRKIIALLVGYRGIKYLCSAQNALLISLLINDQLLLSVQQREKKDTSKKQNESFGYGIKFINKEKDGEIETKTFFLTPEQKEALKCSHPLQIITGPPGSGKTLILLLKILHAAYDEDRKHIPLVWYTWPGYKEKLESFLEEQNKIKTFSRSVQYGFGVSIDNARTDVIRDEMGFSALGFLKFRSNVMNAKKQSSSSGKTNSRNGDSNKTKTVCVITGGLMPSDMDLIKESFRRLEIEGVNFRKLTLSTVMRNATRIFDYWVREFNDTDLKIGHSVYGKEPEIIFKETYNEVTHALKERLVLFLGRQQIKPKDVAVITPTEDEAIKVRTFLNKSFKQEFKNCKGEIRNFEFGDINDQIKSKTVTAVVGCEQVLSHEWPIVLMYSPICSDTIDAYHLIASSRAVGLLIIFERDYQAVQNIIDNSFEQATPPIFHANYMTQITGEANEDVIQFHKLITSFRQDFLSEGDTLADCLNGFQYDDIMLDQFIRSSSSSCRFLEIAQKIRKSKRKSPHDFKIVFINSLSPMETKLARFLFNTGKHNLTDTCEKFLRNWRKKMEDTARKEENQELLRIQPIRAMKTHSDMWQQVVATADLLIENTCKERFIPRQKLRNSANRYFNPSLYSSKPPYG